MSRNQYDALASFVFNIGVDNFRHSAVLRRINEGQLIRAAFAMEVWRMADLEGERIVVDALVRRRAAEKALFLTPDGGWIPAPSALIEPKADLGLVWAAPEAEAADAPNGADVTTGHMADDDEASPVERAAANLAVRLEALAPEARPDAAPETASDPPPVAPALGAPQLPGEPAPFPDEIQPEAASPTAETSPAPLEPREPANLDLEAMRRTLFGAPEPRARLHIREYAPVALLGGVGLAVFIGAVIWAFHAKVSGPITPLNLGVVLFGFVGILCVAAAVYLLLEKLAVREP